LGTKLRPATVWVAAWPEYGGRGGDVQGSSANGGAWEARRGRCASSTWHRPGDPHASCTWTRTRRSTHRVQAKSTAGLAGIGEPAPAGRHKGRIASIQFFPGSKLQKGNSKSKPKLLNIVNCVENRREFRKMWNQFC
jgi:hypothetical protein